MCLIKRSATPNKKSDSRTGAYKEPPTAAWRDPPWYPGSLRAPGAPTEPTAWMRISYPDVERASPRPGMRPWNCLFRYGHRAPRTLSEQPPRTPASRATQAQGHTSCRRELRQNCNAGVYLSMHAPRTPTLTPTSPSAVLPDVVEMCATPGGAASPVVWRPGR